MINHKIYIIKGFVYSLFFILLGIVIMFENIYLNGEYSKIIRSLSSVYPSWFLSLAFIGCGISIFVYAKKDISWNVLSFHPFYLYYICTVIAFFDGGITVANLLISTVIVLLTVTDLYIYDRGMNVTRANINS